VLEKRLHTLSGADRSNEWTSARERRVENFAVGRLGTVRVQALTAAAGDTAIAAGVQDSDTHKAKFCVLGTLPSSIGGREVSFVVAVGSGDNVCRFDSTAVIIA
jgi:hypothetical protein